MTRNNPNCFNACSKSETMTIAPDTAQPSTAPSLREPLSPSPDNPQKSAPLFASQRLEPVYAAWAPLYRGGGYNRLPIRPGSKTCNYACWYVAMTDLDFEATLRRFPDRGNGLLMASVFPDGTKMAALEVDGYMSLADPLMLNPRRLRRGVRGLGIFVLLRGQNLGNVEFRINSEFGPASLEDSEALGTRKIRVVHPTSYPKAIPPDLWTGPVLHEISFNEPPVCKSHETPNVVERVQSTSVPSREPIGEIAKSSGKEGEKS